MSVTTTEPKRSFLPGWVVIILRVILVAALPLVLILVNARVLMTEPFMQWEYNRADFSPDPFGFTKEDRLTYAPLALGYLFNDQGTSYLGDQTLPDGTPLYNERELSHMDDVKRVTQGLTQFGLTLIAVYLLAVVLLAISEATRPALYRSLMWGSVVTVVVILLGLVVTVTSFDWLFRQFHGLFFTGNTWIFPTSDTLIRLFPEMFWLDAFALMFGGAIVEAIVLGIAMWRLTRKKSTQ